MSENTTIPPTPDAGGEPSDDELPGARRPWHRDPAFYIGSAVVVGGVLAFVGWRANRAGAPCGDCARRLAADKRVAEHIANTRAGEPAHAPAPPAAAEPEPPAPAPQPAAPAPGAVPAGQPVTAAEPDRGALATLPANRAGVQAVPTAAVNGIPPAT